MLDPKDQKFLQDAYNFLENESFLIKIANLVGKPLELAQTMLPATAQATVSSAVQNALKKALVAASATISKSKADHVDKAIRTSSISKWAHTAAASMTGAAGGAFGLVALPIELPITTTIILRAIASIADEFGEDISRPELQLECLYVFSMGSKNPNDDQFDSAYLTSRAAFAQMISKASQFLANETARTVASAIQKETAPALLQFIARVAATFEVSVTQKFMAQSIPIVGAAGGAALNGAFCEYFASAARYHFGIKALERKYSVEVVKEVYQTLSKRDDKYLPPGA